MHMAVKKVDPFLSAKVRAIAEEMHKGGQHETQPKRAATVLRVPLEEIGEDGLNLSLSMTGTHFVIKI